MKQRKHFSIQLFVLACIIALLLPAVAAQIAIESFTATPETVQPGKEIQLKLVIESAGEGDIENVLVALDLTSVPFAPAASSNEKIIDEIEERERETVYFQVQALPSAESQVYKIPVIITQNGQSKTSFVGVEVSAPVSLDVLLDTTEALLVGSPGKVVLKVVNKGLIPIKFLTVMVRESPSYELLSPATAYIGEVDVGDFETEEFSIIPRTADPTLSVRLEYRDAANRPFSELRQLPLRVYTPEEAQQLGLVEASGFFSPLLVLLAVGVIALLIFRKFRKRNHAQ